MALLKSRDERSEDKASRQAATEARKARDSSPARRFEYKVKRIGKDKQTGLAGSGRMEDIFNKFGSQGWELVDMNMERAVFKREIVQISQAELEDLAGVDGDDD